AGGAALDAGTVDHAGGAQRLGRDGVHPEDDRAAGRQWLIERAGHAVAVGLAGYAGGSIDAGERAAGERVGDDHLARLAVAPVGDGDGVDHLRLGRGGVRPFFLYTQLRRQHAGLLAGAVVRGIEVGGAGA